MQLANRIRKITESLHYSQVEIAYKCGISPSAYGQIERKVGKCIFETLRR